MRQAIVGLALALAAGPAVAEDAARQVRWLGELAGMPEGAPTRIVVEASLSAGYGGPYEVSAEGWVAVLAPGSAGDDFDATCVSGRCAIDVGFDGGDLALSADLAGGADAPVAGRYTYTANGEAPVEGEARFTPLTGPAPGLSAFAAADAVSAEELSAWLDITGFEQGFTNIYQAGPPTDRERRGLAQWQAARERPGGGLLLEADLAALRAEAKAARDELFWQNIQGRGWSGSYPAGILHVASGAGSDGVGRRFASETGDAFVEFTQEPPMTEEAWDAFVEARTADREGREGRGYTRVNDDMEIAYEEAGQKINEVYHRREGGVSRMILAYPVAKQDDWRVAEAATVRAFRATAP
ncbi:MAG: hypothetical protein IT546_02830 [Caulobacteraceae bacterium]|nr:hypothetical protein [Caulobacteraceae bacterium]